MRLPGLTITAFLVFPLLTTAQNNYTANGNTGAGGAIGNSSLRIADNGSQISFTLTKGTTHALDNITVIYIDSRPGGYTSTSGFSDHADPLRAAISATDGPNRCTIRFPNGFEPDFAIAIDPGSAVNTGAVYELVNGGNNAHNFRATVSLSPAANENSPVYSMQLRKQDVDILGAATFRFVITCIGAGAYLSNEGYGGGLGATNPGRTEAEFTSFLTYPLAILPIDFIRFEVKTRSSDVWLEWDIQQTGDLRRFYVERSRTGVSFTPIAEIQAAAGNQYSYIDKAPAEGNNFYRIRAVDNQDYSKFSWVRQSLYNRIDNSIFIYSNPVKDQVRFSTANLRRGQWDLLITGSNGQRILAQTLNKGDQVVQESIALPPGMQKGVYYLVISNRYEFYKQRFVVQ